MALAKLCYCSVCLSAAAESEQERKHVGMIDFANSYIGPYAREQNAGARIQIEAACTLIDETSGTSDTCYLIAPCRGENMYEESGLFKMPSYDWRAIFSENEHLIVRKGWTSESNRNTLSSDSNNPLVVRTIANTQSLRSYAEAELSAEEALCRFRTLICFVVMLLRPRIRHVSIS